MVRGATAILSTAVLAVALIAAPTATSLAPPFSVKVAKHKDGRYKDHINSSIGDGETQSFWFRVKSTSDTEDVELTFNDVGSSDDDGFKTRWFKHGENISSAVEGAGYDFKIDPGQKKYFNAKQTAPDPTGKTCIAGSADDGVVYFDQAEVAFNGTKCAF